MNKVDLNIHREEIELLIRQKVSQQKIANEFGVSHTTIGNWLKKWEGSSNFIPTMCRCMLKTQNKRFKIEGATKDDLETLVNKLWEKPENRRCYYSNIELTSENGFFNTISAERLDESKSYLYPGNTVLICRLFQSASKPVGCETENTIITQEMKDQILQRPDSIKRISNNRGQKFEDGMIYKKLNNFNINFDDAVEVETEMQFLPRGMKYDKNAFVVTTQDGKRKRFGLKTHETKAGRFQRAMEFYKNEYHDDLNEDVEHYVNYKGCNNKILIYPNSNIFS